MKKLTDDLRGTKGIRVGVDVWRRVQGTRGYLGETIREFVEKAIERRLLGIHEGELKGRRVVVEVGWEDGVDASRTPVSAAAALAAAGAEASTGALDPSDLEPMQGLSLKREVAGLNGADAGQGSGSGVASAGGPPGREASVPLSAGAEDVRALVKADLERALLEVERQVLHAEWDALSKAAETIGGADFRVGPLTFLPDDLKMTITDSGRCAYRWIEKDGTRVDLVADSWADMERQVAAWKAAHPEYDTPEVPLPIPGKGEGELF